eukprot:7080719-Pyramimonas_sp.AAC.2
MMRAPKRSRHEGGGGRRLNAMAERAQTGPREVFLDSLDIPNLRGSPAPHLGIRTLQKHRMHTRDNKATSDILST